MHEKNQEKPLCKKIQNYIFKFSDKLGQGNFSSAYKGHHEITNEIVAIKIIDLNFLKSKRLEQLLFCEIDVLKQLKHPNILRCFEVYSSNRNCYIITQLCNEGDLESKLRKKNVLSEREAQSIIKDVYEGLLYLAEKNVIHRDLKVANVFMHNGRAKIADFGFAKFTPKNIKDINIGSPLYMSPQGIISHIYGPKTDVWAFGVLVYELFHGKTPYSHCQSQNDLKQLLSMPFDPKRIRDDLSNDIKQIIIRCLQVDERRRISAFELKNLPYFKKILQQQFYSQQKQPMQPPMMDMRPPFVIRDQNRSGGQLTPQLNQRNSYYEVQNNHSRSHYDKSRSTHRQNTRHQYSPQRSQKLTSLNNSKSRSRSSRGLSIVQNCKRVLISCKVSFKEAINILHYCRLTYKYLIFIQEDAEFRNEKESVMFSRWLMLMLEDVNYNVECNQISYEGENAQLREQKLKEVVSEYLKKYAKQLSQPLSKTYGQKISTLEEAKSFIYLSFQKYSTIMKQRDHYKVYLLAYTLLVLYESTEKLIKCHNEGSYNTFAKFKQLENYLGQDKSFINRSVVRSYQAQIFKTTPNFH